MLSLTSLWRGDRGEESSAAIPVVCIFDFARLASRRRAFHGLALLMMRCPAVASGSRWDEGRTLLRNSPVAVLLARLLVDQSCRLATKAPRHAHEKKGTDRESVCALISCAQACGVRCGVRWCPFRCRNGSLESRQIAQAAL